MKAPKFWGLHAEPTPKMNWLLAAVPFLLLIAVYLLASHARLSANPHDKILPSFSKMAETTKNIAFKEDPQSGQYVMLNDTLSSLKRIGLGVSAAAFAGLMVGLNIGLFPGIRAVFLMSLTFLSVVPPLAILPMLFIIFGVDEFAKVALIFIGTFPMIARDIYLAASKTPAEQITKALTLGASQFQVAYKVILPQIMPRLIEATRLSLGAAWLFLIASEAIASTDGLGYRIFLVRRYLAMDVIIPYVLWITFIGFSADWILRRFVVWKYSWYFASQRD